jgi:hypothetical protein
LQKKILEQSTKHADVIILGSSRIMEISNNIYPNKQLLNIGVSHANVFDLAALTGLIDSLHIKPIEVVINLEPGTIAHEGTLEWQSLFNFFKHFQTKYATNLQEVDYSKNSLLLKRLYNLVSFEYFAQSANFLFKNKSKSIIDIKSDTPKLYGRFANGSIAYPKSYTNSDTLLLNANYFSSLKNNSKDVVNKKIIIDSFKFQLLKDVVSYYKKNNIKITFIMIPFYAQFFDYDAIKQNYFEQYEIFFKKFATENFITLLGGFTPSEFDIYKTDFYDMLHISGSAIKKIYEKSKINK